MLLRSLFLSLLVVAPLNAAVIGISQPAEAITAAHISKLPKRERAAWTAYLKRSEEQMQKDKAALAAERKPGTQVLPVPKEAFSGRSMPLQRDAAWYGSPEARHIADVIVSFQTPAGGWSKNLDMSGPMRQPGQSYTTNNISRFLTPGDFDTPKDPNWNYVGTLDNDATNTELHFLALVSGQTPGHEGDKYRASFLRGIHYLLAAQFPNGGWPQVWPLEGGYHDAITYNDNAVTESAQTLTDVAGGQGNYAFVPAKLRREAAASADHALQCILATQIMVNGRKTVWAQQHDALTLQPVSGRNFEPAALSSGESSDVLIYLMSLPHPSAAVVDAVNAGVAWLKQAAIYGEAWTGGRRTPEGRHLVAQSGAGPIWARYYSLTTGKPIFGDRDKTIHDNVNDLSLERRNGYAWFGTGPEEVLESYASWSKSHR